MSVARQHHLPTSTSAGMVMALVSAASFGTSGTLATGLLRAGWTPVAAVTVRIAVAALALTLPAVMVLRGAGGGAGSQAGGAVGGGWRQWLRWQGGFGGVALYGMLAVAGCQLCYFESMRHLSVAVALLLEYSGTVLVVGWMWAVHHRRPGAGTIAGGAVALAGLALVLGLVGGHAHVNAIGVVWGIGAAVGNGAYFVMAAGAPRLGSSTSAPEVPPVVVAWGGMAIGSVAMGLVAVTGLLPWSSPATTVVLGGQRVGWLVPIGGLALVAAAFAYAAGIAAARLLGARVSSFLGLSEVLFASLYAFWVLGQGLGGSQLLGGLLVLAGIVLVRRDPETDVAGGDLEAGVGVEGADASGGEEAAGVLAGVGTETGGVCLVSGVV